MKNFNQPETPDTPSINVNIEKREVSMSGKCFPANAREFFGPFRNWLDDHLNENDNPIRLNIDLEYFNTSSSLVLLEIMRQLVKSNKCVNHCISWIYEEEDEDIKEAGIEYNQLLNNKLEVISKPRHALYVA